MKEPYFQNVTYENNPYPPHQKTLGWASILALGVGGINLSLYTFPSLVGTVGTIGILLCIIGIVIAWCLIPAYKELLLIYPNMIGGVLSPVCYLMKDALPIFASLLIVTYSFAIFPGISFAALSLSKAINPILPFEIHTEFLATIFVLFVTLLTFIGIRLVAYIAIPFAAIAICLGVLSAILPLTPGGSFDFERATQFQMISPAESSFGTFSTIMAGFFLVAFGAPAFDVGLTYVGEMKNPKRNLSIMLIGVICVSAFYYIVFPFVWYGTLGGEALQGEDLVAVLTPTFVQMGTWSESFSRLFVISNSVVSILSATGCSYRFLAQMAEYDLMPRIFARRNVGGCQWIALLFSAFFGCLEQKPETSIPFNFEMDSTWIINFYSLLYPINLSPAVDLVKLFLGCPEKKSKTQSH